MHPFFFSKNRAMSVFMILERSQHGGMSFTKSQCEKDCL